MIRRTRIVRWSVIAGALSVGVAVVLAGPLNPPVGPVTSTNKTLAEVEPRAAVNAANTPGDADSLFKIAQPGSYYLTGNMTGVAGKHGIEIEASGVTLDLNGFDVAGVPGALGGVASLLVACENISVNNGTVRGWGSFGGVYLAANSFSQVARVRAVGNAGDGIRVATRCTVIECDVQNNAGDGIECNSWCAVSNCTANGNSENGVLVGIGSSVHDCKVYGSSNNGILTDYGCLVSQCTVYGCLGMGIWTFDGGTVTSCSTSNCSRGIMITSGGTVEDCCAFNNSFYGIYVGAGATVRGCTVRSNSVTGIFAGTLCTIADCTAGDSRGSAGITVGAGSTVAGCTSGANVGDGIVASSNCQIRGNTCQGNGVGAGTGTGVNLTGDLNRVEANVCTGADFGIFVAGIRNVIIRNTCGGNINNWNVASGNYLLVINPSTTTAVSGNTGGVSIAADPNANISY